jgi:hypothetical protein
MFGTIRRHQNWLWILIITVVIISFVIFFTPDAKFRMRGEKTEFGTINGRAITAAELREAQRELLALAQLTGRRRSDNIGMDEAKQRVLMIESAKQLCIQVGDEAVAKQIAELFADPKTRVFNKQAYTQFADSVLPAAGLTEADMIRLVRHELARHQVSQLTGLSGRLVTARAAEPMFRREHEEFLTEAVFINYSNYLASVTVKTNDLTQFFTNRLALYRIPERAIVSYVHFATSNFFAEAEQTLAKDTNLTSRIESEFQKKGTNAFLDATGITLSPEGAKKKIREQFRDDLAMDAAKKKATEVANELFGMQPTLATNLNKIAAQRGLAVKVTEPFSANDRPKDVRAFSFASVAFRLSEQEPLAEPVLGTDGIYLMAFKGRVPSESPAFATVQAKVAEDYKKSQAQELARTAGIAFARNATNAIAAGKTFKAAAAEAKFDAVELPKFSITTTELENFEERVSLPMIKNSVVNLKKGQVSQFIPGRDGGTVVYLKDRLPVTAQKITEEFPAFLDEMRDSRESYAFSEWFSARLREAGFTPRNAQMEP